ncbi:MAG: DUF3048 domain-containing protein [Chloroflexi bacterium]|nr:DUF3048 domain-containing protein [Chloroflexota bacterium]
MVGALARRKRAAIIGGGIIAAVMILGISLGLVFALNRDSSPPALSSTPKPQAKATPTPRPVHPALLDGVLLSPPTWKRLQARLPLAVMIDNHLDARPPVGLSKAELVYETVAEGGITRFMAVFWRNDAAVIEPVRSARVYYLDWAKELGAIYVHWGQAESFGPADVPSAVVRLRLPTLNAFNIGTPTFWRDYSRYSPHNGVTSTAALWQKATELEYDGPSTLRPWKFKRESPGGRAGRSDGLTKGIDIAFGTYPLPDYAVRWVYDRKDNIYLRRTGGLPHFDGQGGRLRAKNVAVQFANIYLAGDGTGHMLADTSGEGPALLFRDGIVIHGTWRKNGPADRTLFFNAAGAETVFNRGTTWVEVVPVGSPVAY